jgi:hypothetical protein
MCLYIFVEIIYEIISYYLYRDGVILYYRDTISYSSSYGFLLSLETLVLIVLIRDKCEFLLSYYL